MRYATVERLVPWDVQQAISAIETASNMLTDYCSHVKDSEPHTCKYLEYMIWELHKKANDLKDLRYKCGNLVDNLSITQVV